MKNDTEKIFLLLTIIFLLVSLSAVNATDDNITVQNNHQIIEEKNNEISTTSAANQDTIKSDINENNTVKHNIIKQQPETIKKSEDKIDTTLTIKFTENQQILDDEYYLMTHIDKECTLDIKLTEDKYDTPLNANIELYLLDNPIPEILTLNNGHIQKTFTVNQIGEGFTIFAQYNGDDNYNAQTSDTLYLDVENYETTVTLDEIQNQEINSTVMIQGDLFYDENIPIENATLTIKLNNNLITTVITNSQGKYSSTVNLENLPVQERAILTVEYDSPTEKFTDAYDFCYFDIEKIKNTITCEEIENSVVQTPITFMGSINNNNNIFNGIMTAKIVDENENEVYSNNSFINNNGNYSFSFTPNKAGTYILTLKVVEDDYYCEVTEDIYFDVEIATLYLNIEEDYESLILENVSITGCIVNENDNPMSNIPIEISTDNNILGQIITDSKGNFNFTQYTFDSMPEDDFITIYFKVNETENYDSLYEEASYFLSRRNVNITLTGDEKIKINQTLHLNGVVVDSYENIIPDGTVSIFINDEEKLNQIPISPTGNYNAEINISQDYIGLELLHVESFFIPDNINVYYDQNFDSLEVKNELIQTTLKINSTDVFVQKETDIIFNLEDEFGNNLNENLLIVIRNESFQIVYNEIIPLNNGTTTISFTPPSEGRYYIYADYSGKENIYVNSHDESILSADKTPTIIHINNIDSTVYVNDTLVINGTLTDINQNKLDAQLNIEIIGSTQNNSITINAANGEYNTAFTPTMEENITVRVSYDANDKYLSSYSEVSFKVIKHETTVIIDPLNSPIKYKDNINIGGNVFESNTMENANGIVEIYINNNLIDTVTLENGEFNAFYLVDDVGLDNIIKVLFIENNAFCSSESNVTYEVIPLMTNITINPCNDTQVNQTITVTGTLTDEKGNNLTAHLKVLINNQEMITDITAENGFFSFHYTPNDVKNYIINVTYNGDNLRYTQNSTSIEFNTIKGVIEVVNNTITLDNKENIITVNGTLIAENISTGNIKVIITVGENDYETFTDVEGNYEIKTEKLVPDEYPIEIHINETDYIRSHDENLEIVTIAKDTPIISLNEIVNVTYSENVTITGNVTDSYNRQLNNTNLTIKINANTYHLTTDTDGKFTQNITDFNTGINTLTIIAEETAYTTEATINTIFTANKQYTKIILFENERVLPQDNFTINGQLLDINNNQLTNKTVTLIVNNKKYTSKTDLEGKFNLTIKKAKLGQYNINVSFIDDDYYLSTTNKTINVTKLTVNIAVDDVETIVGENIVLRARLTDEYGNNVTGGNIVFKVNGRTLRMDDRFDTDTPEVHKFNVNNGLVEYVISADLYLRSGKNISVSYSGSSLYESARSNTANLSVKLRNATIHVETQQTVKQHDSLTLTATVEDVTKYVNNTTLINQDAKVIFKINDITLKDEYDNIIYVPVINNTATYNYSIGIRSAVDANNNTRNYTITAVYINPNYYPDVKDTTINNVEKSAVKINITQIKVNDTSLSLKANLTDYLGYNLEGNNKICVKINGITYKEEGVNKYYTITNGVIDLNDIHVEGIKVKSVEIVTGERQAYYGARLTTTDIIQET